MTTRLARALSFLAVLLVGYGASLAVTSKVGYAGRPILAYLSQHLLEPGGEHQTLRRFREAEGRDPVDVVFFGSSHAYRGFDPRLFAEAGYTSQNLGSTNQTPLNSVYLARRYLPRLSPRLVVVEIYYATLAGDGFESARDLLVNTTWTWEMQAMAFATHQLGAINFGAAKGLGLLGDLSGVEQRVIPTERYVAGGYCETTRVRRTLDDRPPFRVTLDPRQLDELVRLSEIGAAAGARVLWVSHPLPADHLRALENRAAIHHAIRETAERAGVVYRSYEDLDLDPLADFFDFHHLNARGVERFNRALLADLERP